MNIVNLDCVILAERPKLAPYIDEIRKTVASHLDIDVNQVSVKAKTGEGIGPIGNAEAVAARVVVLVAKI